MGGKRNYAYSIEVGVDCKLSDEEKNRLMLALSSSVQNVLGEARGGTCLIASAESAGQRRLTIDIVV